MKKSKNVSKKLFTLLGEGLTWKSQKLYNCILVICRQILETGLALGKKMKMVMNVVQMRALELKIRGVALRGAEY